MDVIRIQAPSGAHAHRLMTSLDGGFASRLDGDGGSVVGLTLDSEAAERLVELFDALGRWLSDGRLVSCQVSFGERTYTLLASKPGEVNDPTSFLLERTIQLQTALDSRIVVEQAKGILAERESLDPEEAFEEMRRQARSRRIKLHDLATEIIATVSKPSAPC
jgi:ANTAR domain